MNREILFRGKRPDNREWVFGSYRFYKHPELGVEKHFITEESCITGAQVIPETVGQLWIPSNGIRVFGGDLVTAICSPCGSRNKKERICQIIDTDTGFDISVLHNGEWWAYGFMDFSSIKVTGNIHDNLELNRKEVNYG